MIARITGKLVAVKPDSVLVDVGGLGYEVWMPQFSLRSLAPDSEPTLTLFTYQYFEGSGGNHLIPRLTGFMTELDREFFLHLTRVQDVGPRKALSAMAIPTPRLAKAILDGDTAVLRSLKGVGPKMAAKIIATLSGAMGKFALMHEEEFAREGAGPEASEDIADEALVVLTSQLGYRQNEAKELVRRALQADAKIKTTDELLTAVFRLIGSN